jgi:pyridinium-3,5-bisthiocarboxylic acid mononucleotide nickel chelatase
MRILYYDCFSGISGDMNLGALIDLGVDKDYLINELAKLKVSGYKIEVTADERKGITGTKVKVRLLSEEQHQHHGNCHHHDHAHNHEHGHHEEHEHNHHHNHDHQHDEHEHSEHSHQNEEHTYHNHGDHEHSHEHAHSHAEHKHDHNYQHIHIDNHEHNHGHTHTHGEGEHVHRNLKAVEDIINNSSLSDRVKNLSLKMFLKVAEAEAKIHGKDLMEVHFHEVGALDSIVDIIGSAICLDYLKVDKVMASSVELGGGFVKCAHGLFPVPAPATAEILKGVPVKLGAVQVETTTPTGAAILAATVDEFTDKKEFTIKKVAYGIGHRDTVIPNVLRVYLGELDEKSALNQVSAERTDKEYEEAYVLECNIDDMNPEAYDYVMEKLFTKGAMDVFLTPIIMKKGRPAVKLSVLCDIIDEKSMTELLLRETTTLGVRKYKVEKTMLRREFNKLTTKYGEVTVKSSLLNGEKIKSKPEYEDCKRLAKKNNVPLSEIYSEINRVLNK